MEVHHFPRFLKFFVVTWLITFALAKEHDMELGPYYLDPSERSLIEELMKVANDDELSYWIMKMIENDELLEKAKNHPHEAAQEVIQLIIPYKEKLGPRWNTMVNTMNDFVLEAKNDLREEEFL